MLDFIVLEKDFENIKKGSEIEVILKDGVTHVNGKVVDNSLEKLQIDEVSTDTTIRYEQIKSVKVFS